MDKNGKIIGFRRVILAVMVTALILLSKVSPVGATDSRPQTGPSDPQELESFLDGIFAKQMGEYHIAGLTFALVKDGQLFFQKGYGYADLEKQTRVEPATTVFRIGSVTKLFTWTAVLQLAEQGKLNLDADINNYLDFKIPDTFPEPITLKHLMTHTAGFEARAFEMVVARFDQLQPLGQFLSSHIPARVRPVGQVAAYSNYGADLAGYIVERVSGMTYADYVETNIFKPLSMDHTTALLPLPSELASQLSKAYLSIQGDVQLGEFKIPGTQPSSSISSTAADMARFMSAHLNDGQLSNGQGKILDSPTDRLMQSHLWTPDERLTGFTYGFFERVINGQRVLYHGGDISPFHSLLVLIPDQNLGFFVSYNTQTSVGLPDLTLSAFLEHYYPQEQAAPQSLEGFNARASRFAGYYRLAGSPVSTVEKANLLQLNWIEVNPSDGGTLLVGAPFSSQKVRLVEVGQLLFREPESGVLIAFREDRLGNISYLFDSSQPGMSFEKLPWHANPYLHFGLLGACFVLFLSVILTLPVGNLLNRFKKGKPVPQRLLWRVTRWLAFLIAAVNSLAFGYFLVLFTSSGFAVSIAYGQVSGINIILAIWLAGAILTLPLIIFIGLSWKNQDGATASRVYYTLVTIASLAFIWFLNYWNLLGFRY